MVYRSALWQIYGNLVFQHIIQDMSDEWGMGMNGDEWGLNFTHSSEWMKFNPHSSPFPIHPTCPDYYMV